MWQVFHAYRNLVEEGKVKALTCPDDGYDLVTVLNPDDPSDNVWLWCPYCDTMISPGLNLVEQVLAVVTEHDLEI